MWTALILVCSLTQTPQLADCNKDSAIEVWTVANESGDVNQCIKAGHDYMKSLWQHRVLKADEVIVVRCLAGILN